MEIIREEAEEEEEEELNKNMSIPNPSKQSSKQVLLMR